MTYWEVTDRIVAVTRNIAIDGSPGGPDQLDQFLDVEPQLLNAALTNLGAAALLVVLDKTGIEPTNTVALNALMLPLNAFEFIPGCGPTFSEFLVQVFRRVVESHGTTAPQPYHSSFDYLAISPVAQVLHQALPGLVALVQKNAACIPAQHGQALDPREPTSAFSEALTAIQSRLRTWVRD